MREPLNSISGYGTFGTRPIVAFLGQWTTTGGPEWGSNLISDDMFELIDKPSSPINSSIQVF